MNATPQTPATPTWKDLQEYLAGSFTARARGLRGNTFVLQKDGLEAGRLLLGGLRGAEFAAGGLAATIERTADGGYRMFSGGRRILAATPGTSCLESLEIEVGGRAYSARISFLRNRAGLFSREGDEAAALVGNAVGRRYRITVDAADTLPATVLLLYHTAVFRRRVYTARAGFGTGRVARG